MSNTYIEEETIRAGLSILPYLSVGFAIMAIASITFVGVTALHMEQFHVTKVKDR